MKIFASLKFRYSALLVISFAAVIAYSVWLMEKEKQSRLDLVAEQLAQSTRLIGIAQRDLLNQSQLLLDRMVADPDTSHAAACEAAFDKYASSHEEYLNVGRLDQAGNISCMALKKDGNSFTLANFPFVQLSKARTSMVVSDIQISPVTGKPTVYLAQARKPTRTTSGNIYFVALDLGWLNNRFAEYSTLRGGELQLLDGKGQMIAQFKHDQPSRTVTDSVPESDIVMFQKLLSRNQVGSAIGTEEQAGDALISFSNFTTTTSGPAYLVAILNKDVALAPVMRSFYLQMAVTTILLSAIWILIFYGGSKLFVSRINALYQVTRRLAAGDLKARVRFKADMDELDTLGHAFDQMAETLQKQKDQLEERNVELARVNRSLKVLSAGNRALLECATEQELMKRVCQGIVEFGEFGLAAIASIGPEGDNYLTVKESNPEAALPLQQWFSQFPENEVESILDRIRSKESAIFFDGEEGKTPPHSEQLFAQLDLKSIVFLPLETSSKVDAILIIGSRESGEFQGDELSYLKESARDTSFGMTSIFLKRDRDRLSGLSGDFEAQLRHSLEDTLAAIATALEMRDPYTAGHERRVAQLASSLAAKLGLSQEETHGIFLAGLVHDIGKMKIPAEILVKPAALSDIEYSLVKGHVSAGYEILKGIDFPWPIKDLIHQHHERMDGSGYPNKLTDGDILFGSRILAVADVVESMASHRPYRPALGVEAALDEIKKGRGTKFDAKVVDACVALFEVEKYEWPQI